MSQMSQNVTDVTTVTDVTGETSACHSNVTDVTAIFPQTIENKGRGPKCHKRTVTLSIKNKCVLEKTHALEGACKCAACCGDARRS